MYSLVMPCEVEYRVCVHVIPPHHAQVMTAARSTPEHQAEAAAKFSKTFEEMLTAGLTLAGASKV